MVHTPDRSSRAPDEDVHHAFEIAGVQVKLSVAASALTDDERVLTDEQMAAIERRANVVTRFGTDVETGDREASMRYCEVAVFSNTSFGRYRGKAVAPVFDADPIASACPCRGL